MGFYNSPYSNLYTNNNSFATQPLQGNSYPYPVAVPQYPVNQQIQNGGLISIGSEDEARAYPIAPGNSITFKDENQPYVYVKTMGFNQMEQPTFKKYKLVEEKAPQTPEYVTRQEFEKLKKMITNKDSKETPKNV